MNKVQYIDKAKVLAILGDNPELVEKVNQLMTFTLPERNGHWILKSKSDTPALFECSVCGYHNIITPYFCYYFGTLMNGKVEEQ